MQHLTHQSSLTAKPNLCLIKEISFILSFSTTKKKSKIAVIAETLFQQHCNCSDHRETSFSPVTRLTYHLIRNKSTAPQMVIIYELLTWCDQITVKSLLTTTRLRVRQCPFPTKDHFVNNHLISQLFPVSKILS